MKAKFKIRARCKGVRNGARATEMTVEGEITCTGDGPDPTLPQMVNSLMIKVGDEHPWIHQATRLKFEIEPVG